MVHLHLFNRLWGLYSLNFEHLLSWICGRIKGSVEKQKLRGNEGSWGVCVCVGQYPHYPESSVGKGTVHSSCVQVSWLDLFICIHLHAVKRSCCWQLPEPTAFLDPGPILSAWLHSTAKRAAAGSCPGRSASMRASVRCLSVDRHQLTLMTSKCHWVRALK